MTDRTMTDLTTEPIERLIEIDTDVGALMLHHPGALREFEGWSVGWYDEGCAHEPVARDGRLVVWGTGGDASYRVRVVVSPDGADPLSDAERSRLVATHEGRCDASLGALFLDNGDGLPGEERRDDPADMAERRIDLPAGRYRARVHALDNGADGDQDGTWDGPDFVVALSPVGEEQWEAIASPTYMPDLTRWPVDMRDSSFHDDATLALLRETSANRWLLPHVPDAMPDWDRLCELLDDGFLAAGTPARGRYPLVPVPGFVVLPGEHRSVETTGDWMGWTWNAGLGGSPRKFLHEYTIAAPELKDSAPAVLCRITGASHAPTEGTGRLRLLGLAPVRLQYPEVHVISMRRQLPGALGREPVEADWWGRELPMMATAHPLPAREPTTEVPLPSEVGSRLRASVDAILRVDEHRPVLAERPSSHDEERTRVAWLRPAAEPLIDWLLRHLSLSGTERLRLWDAPYAERLAGMEEAIAAAEAGWTVDAPTEGSA